MSVQSYVKKALQARIYDAANEFVSSTNGTTYQWEGVSGTKTTSNQVSIRNFTEDIEGAEGQYLYEESMSANYTSDMMR